MKTSYKHYAVVAVLSAMVLAASAETITYDGEGKLTSAVLAGDTVTISDDVTIAAGATVSGYGSLTFTGATATEGVLKLSADQGQAILTGPATLLDTEFTTVITGADLDSLALGNVKMGGASASGDGEPYNVARGPGWVEVQYHNKPATANKVVKARFEQSGADIVGKVLWAGYSNTLRKGADFDLLPYTPSTIATGSYPNNAYGIKSINFLKAALSVAFNGETSLGGVVSNATTGVRVTVKGVAPDYGTADGTGAFYLGSRSQLHILNPHGFAIANSLVGSYGAIDVVTDSTVANPCTNFLYDVLKETEWTVVAANASLASVTNVMSYLGGFSFSASGALGKMYHFSNDGRRLTCQFQNSTHRNYSGHNDYLIKGVLLELRQSGSDILGRTPAARYFYSETGASNPIGMDIMQPNCLTSAVATAVDKNGYCLFKTTLMFDRPLPSAAGIKTNNKNARGTIRVKGTVSAPASLRVDSGYGLSTVGEADVLANGEMALNYSAPNETAGIANGGEFNIRVHPGGTLRQCGENVFGDKILVCIDGGDLVLGYGRTDDGYCHAYLPQLFLRNGARVTGLPPRVGKLLEEGVWKVDGSSPSVCSNGITLIGTKTSDSFASKWVLDVADTGSGVAADFLLCGDVTHGDSETYPRIEVEKRGAGVLAHGGEWNAPTRRVVSGGTWRFASSCDNAEADISLAGGSLTFDACTTNALGTLSVSAPATLTFGEGAQVSFADSAAEAWSLQGDEKINIVGSLGERSLRFGTSKTLGPKVRAFRLNGTERVHQDSDGYIVPGPDGMIVIVL